MQSRQGNRNEKEAEPAGRKKMEAKENFGAGAAKEERKKS
jgi:hypothetical protein